jgi:hypothetical protein
MDLFKMFLLGTVLVSVQSFGAEESKNNHPSKDEGGGVKHLLCRIQEQSR